MSAKQTNLLQGTLDLLILRSLMPGELHGLGVSRRIEQITRGTFQVKPGSLFPALHRMEEAGWLTSFWGESENNRRAKFYRLTKAGERRLGRDGAMAKDRSGHDECIESDLIRFPCREVPIPGPKSGTWGTPVRHGVRYPITRPWYQGGE